MCVTLCHRRKILYWNHDQCLCPFAGEAHHSCRSCRHRQDGLCALTNGALPDSGGCCHWGIEPVSGQVRVTPAVAAPLVGFYDAAKNILPPGIPYEARDGEWWVSAEYVGLLNDLGIPYQADGQGGLLIDPDGLVLALDEAIPDILADLETDYQQMGGEYWVDPDMLGLPDVFGCAVEY